MTVKCPTCGKEFPEQNAQYNGHIGYHKAHPEAKPKGSPPAEPPKESPPPSASTQTTPSTGTPTKLEPVSFSFSEGERLPNQQEIPEFKSPEEQAKEKEKGEPTPGATLAEERKASESGLTALLLPLLEISNNVLSGESMEFDKEKIKFNRQDAELLSKAIVLVDEKYGGPISKTLGGDSGPEIFLAGVCIGLGVKATIMIRSRQQRRPMRPSAAPSPEEIPRKNPLQEVGDRLRDTFSPKKKEEEPKPEEIQRMSPDQFYDLAEQKRREGLEH
jgi:hypothetical protein